MQLAVSKPRILRARKDYEPIDWAIVKHDICKTKKKAERPVYKMYAFRFVEAGLRRALWYFGRSVPTKKALFVCLPIIFVLLSLIGPIVHHERMNLSLPFDTFVSCLNDRYPATGHSNLRVTTRGILSFNGSNPAYNVIRRNSPAEFAVIMRSKGYGSIVTENSLNSFGKLSHSIKSIVVNYERMNLTVKITRKIIQKILQYKKFESIFKNDLKIQ
uniref:OppC_N domain-containing protein n=1 Tax=Elaeophora elaphi TaxID=1147741 RepID=A0A0R3RK41_9BILA